MRLSDLSRPWMHLIPSVLVVLAVQGLLPLLDRLLLSDLDPDSAPPHTYTQCVVDYTKEASLRIRIQKLDVCDRRRSIQGNNRCSRAPPGTVRVDIRGGKNCVSSVRERHREPAEPNRLR